jgi:hypothetical protein
MPYAHSSPLFTYRRQTGLQCVHRHSITKHCAYLTVVINWLWLLLLHVIETILTIAIAIHTIHIILLLLYRLRLYYYWRRRRARLTYYLQTYSKCIVQSFKIT